jgi:hypothetical protein
MQAICEGVFGYKTKAPFVVGMVPKQSLFRFKNHNPRSK